MKISSTHSLVMNKLMIAIIDFEDSFTFNIYSTLKEMNITSSIIKYHDFKPEDAFGFTHIILGPGPGHVDDYSDCYPLIDSLLLSALRGRYKLIGICLGHQLIHQRLSREVFQLERPIHGQSYSLNFPDSEYLIAGLRNKNVDVQYYNSWAVRNSDADFTFDLELLGPHGEIVASFCENLTTYQFHCESVGTSFQLELFQQILV